MNLKVVGLWCGRDNRQLQLPSRRNGQVLD
jgi:hypothetical protein